MRRAVVLAALAALMLVVTLPAAVASPVATQNPASPSPSVPTLPPGARTPGQRQPLVGALAVVALLVAAGAGVWIYGQIRKGL
ncbi:MAG: hypothetical protein ACRDJ4_11080 [Actinomycetota bacterium]